MKRRLAQVNAFDGGARGCEVAVRSPELDRVRGAGGAEDPAVMRGSQS